MCDKNTLDEHCLLNLYQVKAQPSAQANTDTFNRLNHALEQNFRHEFTREKKHVQLFVSFKVLRRYDSFDNKRQHGINNLIEIFMEKL